MVSVPSFSSLSKILVGLCFKKSFFQAFTTFQDDCGVPAQDTVSLTNPLPAFVPILDQRPSALCRTEESISLQKIEMNVHLIVSNGMQAVLKSLLDFSVLMTATTHSSAWSFPPSPICLVPRGIFSLTVTQCFHGNVPPILLLTIPAKYISAFSASTRT